MNFSKPYYMNIPLILQTYICDNLDMKNFYLKNILYNYIQDKQYFYTKNAFFLKKLVIGPFKSNRNYDVTISSMVKNKLEFPYAEIKFERGEDNYFYYNINFNSNEEINYDIKLMVSAFKFNFYTWVNLWYNTIENLFNYIIDNDIIMVNNDNNKLKENHSPRKSNSSIKEIMKHIEINTSKNYSKNENQEIELIDFDKLNNNEIHNSLKRKRSIANYDLVKSEIGKLIAQFSNDKDLNNLISGVNKIAEKKNIQLFDRENVEINLQFNELDKFEDWFGSIGNNFRIQYIYSLLSTKYNI